MKKTNFGKLALIAGGIYAIKAMSDKSDEEKALNNMFAGLQQNATAENGEIPFSPDQFKRWIDANPALKAALRSGVTAEQVVNQINNNTYTLDNVQLNNFYNSLLANSTGELGNSTNWTYCEYVLESNYPVLKADNLSSSASNTTKVIVNVNRLYRVSGQFKSSSGTYQITARSIDFQNVSLNSSWSSQITSNGSYQSQTVYFGGVGLVGSTSFKTGVFYANFGARNNTNQYLFIKEFHVNEVSLGEPVPSNLPWLPTGQMVYDTTTWEVGIYNGTSVVWFAV